MAHKKRKKTTGTKRSKTARRGRRSNGAPGDVTYRGFGKGIATIGGSIRGASPFKF